MHRDVKPENVLITRDDFAYLVDFGLATATRSGSPTSRTGTWRVAAHPQPFRIFFRASWGEDGRAFLVNRYQPVSRVVLFDRFWTGGASSN